MNSSIFYLLRLTIWRSPVDVIGAIVFKGIFLLFQIFSIWILISWISGDVLSVVKNVLQLDDASYKYIALAWLLLVFASVSAFFSRWLALSSIKKLELYISIKIKRDALLVSDYRNLTKVMLGLIDAFVPLIFISAVLVAWLIIMPELIVPFLFLVVSISAFFRKAIRFSAARFKSKGKRPTAQEYIGSDEHNNFYRILMVSQYVSLAVYIFIASGIVAALVLMQSLEDIEAIGLLPVATAIALLQFKSFIGILVRLGAYIASASKAARLLENASRL